MTSPLERLPAELQVAICHELVRDDATRSDEALKSQQRTFYALCLTSKTLNTAATPFLYATIDTSAADDLLTIRLLTRTLCAEPELAKHVQCLSVAQLSTKLIAPPSEEHIEACKATFDRIRCKDIKEALKFAIERGCSTAEVVALLYVCRNLRDLSIDLSEIPNIKSLTMVYIDLNAADVATLLDTMHDLKELRLQWTNTDEEDSNPDTDDQPKINIQDFFPQLNRHRKTLETLALHDMQGDEMRLYASPTVSFQDFEKLSVLEVSEHAILSHSGQLLTDLSSRLPPNLEDLLLRSDECLTQHLEGILKVLATCQAKELGYLEVTFPDEAMDDDDRAKMVELGDRDNIYPSVGIRNFENIGSRFAFWRGYGQYAYEAAEHYLDLISKHGLTNLLDGKIELARYGFEDGGDSPPALSLSETAAGQMSGTTL